MIPKLVSRADLRHRAIVDRSRLTTDRVISTMTAYINRRLISRRGIDWRRHEDELVDRKSSRRSLRVVSSGLCCRIALRALWRRRDLSRRHTLVGGRFCKGSLPCTSKARFREGRSSGCVRFRASFSRAAWTSINLILRVRAGFVRKSRFRVLVVRHSFLDHCCCR